MFADIELKPLVEPIASGEFRIIRIDWMKHSERKYRRSVNGGFVTEYLDFVPGSGVQLGARGRHKERTRMTVQSESIGTLLLDT